MSLPDFDFETYSEAGYRWSPEENKWRDLIGAPAGTKGLAAVGAAAYCEHPTSEVLSMFYDLKDGRGARLWIPGAKLPLDLFEHIQRGGLIEAHNSGFEVFVWRYICTPRMGWPELPLSQIRCSMSKCRAWSIPASLAEAAEYVGAPIQKDKEGKRLLDKFSKPRNPTKKDPRTRIRPEDDPEDAVRLYSYNRTDIKAEEGVSTRVPDLRPEELDTWLLDQRINQRGVYIDRAAVEDCRAAIEQAREAYTAELQTITGGVVKSASEVAVMRGFLSGIGTYLDDMKAETVEAALAGDDLSETARRVLEIRASLGAASVAKVYAIERRLTTDNRLKDIFAYCGADRTGRWAGRGPQPQNTPSGGPDVEVCSECGRHQREARGSDTGCLWCGAPSWCITSTEWNARAAEDALAVLKLRDLRSTEHYFGDAIATVSGCLRALYCAAPGHDLICSDYSAIEAVVLAALASEQWRLDVFRTHGKIYEMSASKICGIPFEEFEKHKAETGEHHPMRKKVGKVAELASGFGGWVGAWKAFGADKHIGSDKDIKNAILAWRAASPNIVEFWGGQVRQQGDRWEFLPEYYGIEGAAVQALLYPGETFGHNGIYFRFADGVLYCRLLSGRFLSYHQPRLEPTTCRRSGLPIYSITYFGKCSRTHRWIRLDTYGGKLTENIVQATARDLMAEALKRLDANGYPIVLHVHDEAVAEVAEGVGTIEEFEALMSQVPDWAAGWPVKAAGGWRGKRYRKD